MKGGLCFNSIGLASIEKAKAKTRMSSAFLMVDSMCMQHSFEIGPFRSIFDLYPMVEKYIVYQKVTEAIAQDTNANG